MTFWILVLSSTFLISFKNEPEGLRDIKWGTNFNDIKDMIRVIPDVIRCIRKDEKLSFCNAKIDKIFSLLSGLFFK